MADTNTATLSELMQFALPIDTELVTGSAETEINWAVMIRAQPPAFPDIYGGELALISMELLRSYDNRLQLADVIQALAEAGIQAIVVAENVVNADVIAAEEYGISLLVLPEKNSLAGVERAVNKFILNRSAQITERAFEIQRKLTRLAAENSNLGNLLSVIARSTAKAAFIHDESGSLIAQYSPSTRRNNRTSDHILHGAFQNWLERLDTSSDNTILRSPIGYTTILKVEKRIAGYLSLAGTDAPLTELDRLVLTHGADICAIELAKTRAIASAVEQARGDWIQMWLSGTSHDPEQIITRAQQAGFDLHEQYVVVAYRVHAGTETPPLDVLQSLLRDMLAKRQIEATVGQYVDTVVALIALDGLTLERIKQLVDETREQLARRAQNAAAGVSRPVAGIHPLRDAYQEARDAISIAGELGESNATTFYGDLKLYQLLLAMKDHNFEDLQRFYEQTIGPLAEHDDRKQGDLIRTLNGFFEANGNLAKAAQDLDVHRNTLVYRLERISELTDMDLNDADNRLMLHLALKIQRVLATLPTT